MNKKLSEAITRFLVQFAACVFCALIAYHEGSEKSSTESQRKVLIEIKRMCDSKFLPTGNLLLDSELYTCKPTGKKI